jgi:hypothetical protein
VTVVNRTLALCLDELVAHLQPVVKLSPCAAVKKKAAGL